MSTTGIAIVTVLVLIFGLVFVLVGLRLRAANERLLAIGKTTTGVVVGAATRRTYDATYVSKYDVVEFTAEDGKVYPVESAISWSAGAPNVGAQVPVIYNPANPTEARINTFAETKLVWVICLLVGVLVPAGLILALTIVRAVAAR